MGGDVDQEGEPRREVRRWRTFVRGVIVVPLLLLAALWIFSNGSAGWLSDRMAANMIPPETGEMASTALTPPASTMEVAAISGRGEGLDCSIEPIIESRAFRHGAGDVSVNLQYRQACVAHDYCYRHGAATYGYTQADCDAMLARAGKRLASEYFQSIEVSVAVTWLETISRGSDLLARTPGDIF